MLSLTLLRQFKCFNSVWCFFSVCSDFSAFTRYTSQNTPNRIFLGVKNTDCADKYKIVKISGVKLSIHCWTTFNIQHWKMIIYTRNFISSFLFCPKGPIGSEWSVCSRVHFGWDKNAVTSFREGFSTFMKNREILSTMDRSEFFVCTKLIFCFDSRHNTIFLGFYQSEQ